MSDQIRYLPATAFSIAEFAHIYTRSFEHYIYPINLSAEDMAQRIRLDSFDLAHSSILLIDDQPIGMVALGLRGEHAWCGGFGIIAAYRGRGLSHHLMAAFLEQAQRAGASRCSLEVITRNQTALNIYQRAGMRIQRNLVVLKWQSETSPPPTPTSPQVRPEPPDLLLTHFAALHPVPAAWQRDLPTLLTCSGLSGLALRERGKLRSYLLFQAGTNSTTRIMDLGARQTTDILPLLQALQRRSEQIICINEPSDSPFIPAYHAAGFTETERQHEMLITFV